MLEPYQRGGSVQAWLSHIRRGSVPSTPPLTQSSAGFPRIDEVVSDPSSLLVFSGGQTRPNVPFPGLSEASSYARLAASLPTSPSSQATLPESRIPNFDAYWHAGQRLLKTPEARASSGVGEADRGRIFARATTEEFALDSLSNVLFSIARFKESASPSQIPKVVALTALDRVTDRYPQKITVVGYAFKAHRFLHSHLPSLLWPTSSTNYIGIDGDLPSEKDRGEERYGGEREVLEEFSRDRYACFQEAYVLAGTGPGGVNIGKDEDDGNGKVGGEVVYTGLGGKRRRRNPGRRWHGYLASAPEIRGAPVASSDAIKATDAGRGRVDGVVSLGRDDAIPGPTALDELEPLLRAMQLRMLDDSSVGLSTDGAPSPTHARRVPGPGLLLPFPGLGDQPLDLLGGAALRDRVPPPRLDHGPGDGHRRRLGDALPGRLLPELPLRLGFGALPIEQDDLPRDPVERPPDLPVDLAAQRDHFLQAGQHALYVVERPSGLEQLGVHGGRGGRPEGGEGRVDGPGEVIDVEGEVGLEEVDPESADEVGEDGRVERGEVDGDRGREGRGERDLVVGPFGEKSMAGRSRAARGRRRGRGKHPVVHPGDQVDVGPGRVHLGHQAIHDLLLDPLLLPLLHPRRLFGLPLSRQVHLWQPKRFQSGLVAQVGKVAEQGMRQRPVPCGHVLAIGLVPPVQERRPRRLICPTGRRSRGRFVYDRAVVLFELVRVGDGLDVVGKRPRGDERPASGGSASILCVGPAKDVRSGHLFALFRYCSDQRRRGRPRHGRHQPHRSSEQRMIDGGERRKDSSGEARDRVAVHGPLVDLRFLLARRPCHSSFGGGRKDGQETGQDYGAVTFTS